MLEDAGELLGRRLRAPRRGTRSAERRFYDTFDGLLHAAGLEVSSESGRLAVIGAGGGGAGAGSCSPRWTSSSRPSPAGLELAPGPLRDRLRRSSTSARCCRSSTSRARCASSAWSTTSTRSSCGWRSRSPAVITARDAGSRCGRGCGSFGVRGYDDELAEVRDALDDDLGLARAEQPLVDEAVLGRRRRARRRLGQDRRRALGGRALRRGRGGRPGAAARGDRGESARDDRRHRRRVPARLPGRGAPLSRGPARAEGRLPAGRARAFIAASSGGCSRSPATRATSTCTCSTSTTFARVVPESVPARPRPAAGGAPRPAADRAARDGARAALRARASRRSR